MKLKKMHLFGIILGVLIILIALVFFLNNNMNIFLFLIGLALASILLPFIIGIVLESRKDQEITDMFLEFSRSLSESVAAGTPVSKSIINMRDKNFGLLSPYIQKLANQISIGISVNEALQTFAYDVDNKVITRAVALISDAERAGGEIDYILESSAKSIAEVEKLRKERRNAVYSLVVQGYIIFFIFVGIMLVIQFKILPLTANIGAIGGLSANFNSPIPNPANPAQQTETNPALTVSQLSNPLFYLLITQGLFAGLVIGQITEGNLRSGIKHSFILAIAAFLISTGAQIIFG